ncbi:hypothetical protein [Polaromonas sp. UC242_47]|uniref:hypothetical protein n=1 Tax=Polaromonas sp. UC242_47 TaxID=3374626 RepID=UPI0037A32525
MNFEEFFLEAERLKLRIPIVNESSHAPLLLSNEALFHLPLLAMVILTLSKGARKPRSSELGQIVGDCIERTLAGFKGSSQHIGWSANLRIRTIKALTFLELAGLVNVDQNNKFVSSTDIGRKIVTSAMTGETNLAFTLHSISRNYRDIAVEKQIRLELS